MQKIKQNIMNFIYYRLNTKSAIIAIVATALFCWQHEHFLDILDTYIRSDEFKGILIGYISGFVAWLFGKRGTPVFKAKEDEFGE